MTAFGVDPSTKRIGLARPDGTTTSISARAGARDPWRRLHELASAVERELRLYPGARLLVIEGPALAVPGRLALVRIGEVRAACGLAAFRQLLDVVEISPSSLKLFATGSGGADKDAMVAAAVAAGAAPRNDDEADAWHLHRAGELALAGTIPDTLKEISWPSSL